MTDLVDLDAERLLRAERDAELARAELLAKCEAAIEAVGNDVAGFALIVWNGNGEMRTVYDASKGPIGAALLPTLASDALNRHVAVMLAKDDAADDSSTS
ncbi:hypothetical protein [Hyphomicrobium sp. 802]|uniref:hypothetical protein n=1 Tax=Hyphomicrobium sp. 802 TaxID=1112272 RepID=UPI00045E9F90|nr:hypothetical protein [Hyphomicrobium sp. 802]